MIENQREFWGRGPFPKKHGENADEPGEITGSVEMILSSKLLININVFTSLELLLI